MMNLIKQLFDNPDGWVILDTETTGLGRTAEAVSVGILAGDGTTLMDQLIKPTRPIPAEATAIHGITNEMVKDAPTILDILPLLENALTDRQVIIYNAAYDTRIIQQSMAAHGKRISPPQFWQCKIHCAMEAYAEYWGEWNDYRGNSRRQKLTNACAQQGVTVENAHRAIGDCRMVLGLLKAIHKGVV